MEHTSSVRRPESGTWQSVAMETAAMEAVQGPMRDSGPGSSMAECGDGDSSNGRPYRDP
ncbi:unnamed protein product [Staurois parvus]|uniref:Uncharacterized protein n=1 Tax=Staurois parvus TaxID=386267 RepID=A0ABN9B3N7_9NEOB|nr:unnamed protein product [Staurois parvus]CAI9607801.1 unnamed protein product [Staurois parvus]